MLAYALYSPFSMPPPRPALSSHMHSTPYTGNRHGAATIHGHANALSMRSVYQLYISWLPDRPAGPIPTSPIHCLEFMGRAMITLASPACICCYI